MNERTDKSPNQLRIEIGRTTFETKFFIDDKDVTAGLHVKSVAIKVEAGGERTLAVLEVFPDQLNVKPGTVTTYTVPWDEVTTLLDPEETSEPRKSVFDRQVDRLAEFYEGRTLEGSPINREALRASLREIIVDATKTD